MPKPSGALPAIARRDYIEKVMFGYVAGMRRGLKYGLPGITDERVTEHVTVGKAVEAFMKEFSLTSEYNPESLRVTYQRMEAEHRDELRGKEADQRTKQPEQA